MKKVVLRNNKTISINRQHPWIFSGAINSKDNGIEEGDVVYVYDSSEVQLAFGQYPAEQAQAYDSMYSNL